MYMDVVSFAFPCGIIQFQFELNEIQVNDVLSLFPSGSLVNLPYSMNFESKQSLSS